MARQEDVTWEELERVAKNVLRGIMTSRGDYERLQFDACVFVLTRELQYLKEEEDSDEESSSI